MAVLLREGFGFRWSVFSAGVAVSRVVQIGGADSRSAENAAHRIKRSCRHTSALILCVFAAPLVAADDEIHLKTIKVEGATDGGADRGYRSENVSATGPWQGRSLQDTPYRSV
jgi:hypothetical protein